MFPPLLHSMYILSRLVTHNLSLLLKIICKTYVFEPASFYHKAYAYRVEKES